MSYYNQESKDRPSFRDVYSPAEQFLGAVYMNYSAHKWAIKEYPGQWFETEEMACAWLIVRNQPTVKG